MSLSQYLLEFSICLALFYGLYHFLLRKETFFQLNRWYLLLSPVLAMVIPFLDFELPPAQPSLNHWDQLIYPLVTDMQYPQTIFWQNVEKTADPARNFTYLDLLLLFYFLGVIWMGCRLAYRTWKLMRLIGRGKHEVRSGYTVVRAEERLPAASFLSYIFWEEEPLSPERKSILEHELVHVRQWHSLDVLLMEIWVMLKWFHPLIYWYRNSLRLTHEYIADAYVSRTQGSRLEYARLLTNTPSKERAHPLLHHFNSSIKMRLIMLAQQKSDGWKYLKFMGIIPVTALLLLLFSFNLAEELPDPIIDPLVKAEHTVNDLVNQPLLPLTNATPSPVQAKPYQLKWGDLECHCENQQFPNYYRCEDQSLQPRELRRLIRQEGGFQLYLDHQGQNIRELTAVSKYMKDMGGFQGQFDEMDQEFNTESPLWKQIEKGDVFRFTFDNGSGDYFEFEVVINNGKEAYAFGNRVEMGDLHFDLSQFNSHLDMKVPSANVVTLDVEELKRLARFPLKIRKDENTYYKLITASVLIKMQCRKN